MKGLLYKDFVNTKSNLLIYAAVALFYLVVAGWSSNGTGMGIFIIFFFSTIPLQAFSYDSAYHWDLFAVSTPVSRQSIVGARYLFALLCIGASLLFAIAMEALSFLGGGELAFAEQALVTLTCIAVIFIIISIILPLVYQFGVEKGRILMMALYLVPFIIVMVGARIFGDGFSQTVELFFSQLAYLPWVLMVGAAAMFLLSYFCSCRIYQRKEL